MNKHDSAYVFRYLSREDFDFEWAQSVAKWNYIFLYVLEKCVLNFIYEFIVSFELQNLI